MPDHTSEPLFLQSTHDISGRSAVLDEVEGSVWLYLMSAAGAPPERDCWIANTLAHEEQRELQYYRTEGLPPPTPPKVTNADCIVAEPSKHSWELRWNADGDAVAVHCDGKVRGFICARSQASYAYHLRVDGPWGRAWHQQAFEQRFG